MHHSERHNQRKFRTRARNPDIDQVHELLASSQAQLHNLGMTPPEAHDLPGAGEFYCRECAKHFISQHPLQQHLKSKVHKRRLKDLKMEKYTQKDAEAAVGLKTDDSWKSKGASMVIV